MNEAHAAPLGVIEGFYGKTWSEAARADSAKFLHAAGFGFYIYAPKSEAYLRRRWRDAMPEERLTALRHLSSQCRAAGLQFGVGLTPFEIHLDDSSTAQAALRRKVIQLNQAGVDILCILFDDMPGSYPGLAQLQSRVAGDIAACSSASRFIVCPTYYSDDPVLERVFGVAPTGYLQDLGRALDGAIDVFWTGPRVCSSDYPAPHLDQIAQRLGRKPFIWDNHIANDGKARSNHLHLRCAEEWSLDRRRVSGAAINPMNQPYLSRLPLSEMALRFGCATSLPPGTDAAVSVQIERDLDVLQRRGIGALTEPERAELHAQYLLLERSECAREIAAWLRGEYAFDPNCLTD